MPMRTEAYPANWKEISHHIRFVRAGGCCEQCGVKHGAIGARDRFGVWHNEDDIHTLQSDEGMRLFGENFDWKMTKIILTTAHLGVDYPDGRKGDKHNKMDCRYENLAAYCQRCHLAYDKDEHTANRKVTLAKKRAERIASTGQKSLF